MAMSFEQPVNDATLKKIFEEFGEPVAHDRKTFLFDNMPTTIMQTKMKEIANAARQPAKLEIAGDGEIKTMSDGTRYLVTPQGWQKIEG